MELTLEERVAALERKLSAREAAEEPTEYYTSKYSGEEIDALLGSSTRRNLLNNWYFVGGGSQQGGGQFPINQRGERSYSTSYGSIFDCWKCGKPGSVITLAHDYLTLNNVGDLFQITQNVDQGEVVTASILTTDGLFSGTVTIPVATSENIGINVYQGNGITIAVLGLAGGNVQFSILTDTEKNLIAGKLELGSGQTLAYQNEEGNWQLFETPDYAEELAKCQRYFQLYSAADKRPAKAVDCRPTMRIDPTQGQLQINAQTLYYNSAEL